jgi:hypothetical protein
VDQNHIVFSRCVSKYRTKHLSCATVPLASSLAALSLFHQPC